MNTPSQYQISMLVRIRAQTASQSWNRSRNLAPDLRDPDFYQFITEIFLIAFHNFSDENDLNSHFLSRNMSNVVRSLK
jgi:hypothetical protein